MGERAPVHKVKSKKERPSVNPTMVVISVVKAGDLEKLDKNMWGKRVDSDPYVIVKKGKETIATTNIIKNNSKNPVWNFKTKPFVLPSSKEKVSLVCMDKNTVQRDGILGTLDL